MKLTLLLVTLQATYQTHNIKRNILQETRRKAGFVFLALKLKLDTPSPRSETISSMIILGSTVEQATTIENDKVESPKAMLWNLMFNVIIPALILTKLSGDQYLGRVWALVIALLFPFTYGSLELIKNKKWNFISILGLVSVLLTGGLALFKLDGIWFAVKEASIPAVIGIAVLALHNTKYSVFKVLMFSPKIFKIDLVNQSLSEKGNENNFEKLLFKSNLLFASSFLLSSILNFVLAVIMLKSPTGTEAFNKELGEMTFVSYFVIMVPCMIVLIGTFWFLISGIKKLTGLDFEEIVVDQAKK